MDPVHSEAMHMIIKMPTEKDLVSPACVPLDRRQESRSSSQSLLKDTMATAGWCQDFSSTSGHPGTSSPMAQETIILNSQELDLLFSTTTCRTTFTTTAAKLPGTTHLTMWQANSPEFSHWNSFFFFRAISKISDCPTKIPRRPKEEGCCVTPKATNRPSVVHCGVLSSSWVSANRSTRD